MSEDEIIEHAISILESRLRKPEFVVNEPKSASGYLSLQFAGLEHESFRVMFLDNQHGLIELKELFRGTIDNATIYPREVVKTALQFNSAAVILAHNHPSGNSTPSEADRAITRKLVEALRTVDIRVLDHFVIGDKPFSFAENGLL